VIIENGEGRNGEIKKLRKIHESTRILDIRFQCPIGPKNRISTSLVFKSVF